LNKDIYQGKTCHIFPFTGQVKLAKGKLVKVNEALAVLGFHVKLAKLEKKNGIINPC